jgi:prohibitin 2
MVVVLLLVAVVARMSFHIVPPGNRGISVTLGKVAPQFLPEGLNFKMPFVTTVVDMPVKQITVASKAEVFSSDLQNIEIEYSVLYRLPEHKVVQLYQQYAGDPYQSLVEPRVQEILKQLTSTFRAEDLVKNRERIKLGLVDRISSAVEEMVYINDLTVTNMQLSKMLEDAIEQKVIREQEALAKSFELDKAKKEAEITIVKAQAEAESIKIKGEAIKAAPDVIQLEIANKWDGKTPQSVVTTTGGANILLPLK